MGPHAHRARAHHRLVQCGLRQSPFGLSLTPMSCVQVFAVPAVPVPDEVSWQSHTLLESAEFDPIVLPWAFTDPGTMLVTSMPSFTAYLIVLNAISTPVGPVVSSADPSRTA